MIPCQKSSVRDALDAPKVALPSSSESFNMRANQPLARLESDLLASPFLRMQGVMRMTGLGRSTIYRLVSKASFPAPVRLAQRAVAWRLIDLQRWSAARPPALMGELAQRTESRAGAARRQRTLDAGR
jgi:prophage regulatory protein